MNKYNYSPKDCPFIFKNTAPDDKVYVVLTSCGYHLHVDGYGNRGNLYSIVNGFWSKLHIDTHTVHMKTKDDIKPSFLKKYKQEDFDLSNIYKIIADDDENSLTIYTKPYKARVDRLKHQHIPDKEQIKRDLICDKALIYYKLFQNLTVPFYQRLAELITRNRNYDETIFVQDMIILYSFYLISKDNVYNSNHYPGGLAPKMLHNIIQCFDFNVIFKGLANVSWHDFRKQVHKLSTKTNRLLKAETDKAGYLTNKEIKVIKQMQINISETFSDFEFSADTEELKPYFDLSEDKFKDWQSRITPKVENLLGKEIIDADDEVIADNAAKIEKLNNLPDDKFEKLLNPID